MMRLGTQNIDGEEARNSGGLAVREEDEVEDEEDVGEGVLLLGSVSERTRGGAAVLGVDEGEAGYAPMLEGSSWPRWPWLLEAAGQGASGDLWRGGGAEGREGRRETLG